MSEQQYLSVVQNMRLPVSTALLTLAAMLEDSNHLCGLMGHILYYETCYSVASKVALTSISENFSS